MLAWLFGSSYYLVDKESQLFLLFLTNIAAKVMEKSSNERGK
jgi:hypothetical protein